jgi:hypothetical protein
VLGTFLIVYGYEEAEVQSLAQQVDADVKEMFQTLEGVSPEDFA